MYFIELSKKGSWDNQPRTFRKNCYYFGDKGVALNSLATYWIGYEMMINPIDYVDYNIIIFKGNEVNTDVVILSEDISVIPSNEDITVFDAMPLMDQVIDLFKSYEHDCEIEYEEYIQALSEIKFGDEDLVSSRTYCSVCQIPINEDDAVRLVSSVTVMHQGCHDKSTNSVSELDLGSSLMRTVYNEVTRAFLANQQFELDVYDYMDVHDLVLSDVREMYHDAIERGDEERNQLNFEKWFNELSKSN